MYSRHLDLCKWYNCQIETMSSLVVMFKYFHSCYNTHFIQSFFFFFFSFVSVYAEYIKKKNIYKKEEYIYKKKKKKILYHIIPIMTVTL